MIDGLVKDRIGRGVNVAGSEHAGQNSSAKNTRQSRKLKTRYQHNELFLVLATYKRLP